MSVNKLSTEESLQIITDVIQEAKNRFEGNGISYVFWGILLTIVSLSQFILLKNQYYNIHFYPYFLMPVGTGVAWYYSSKKKKNKHNLISKIVSYSWLLIGLNTMCLGFLLGGLLKEFLIPIILLLLAVGLFVSAVSIKSSWLVCSSIFTNFSSFVAFYLEYIHQVLALSAVALIALLIPGVILLLSQKQRKCSKI